MGLFHKAAKISVCIPVYGTENLLEECLASVAAQVAPEGVKDFLEVVVVDDCSPGNAAEGIVKRFRKASGLRVLFERHNSNKGLVEARRTAVLSAGGDFIFNLDSDDVLPSDALRVLYEKAVESGADIVHGSAEVFYRDEAAVVAEVGAERMEAYKESRRGKVQNVFDGTLSGGEILDAYLVKHCVNGFLWGKLFKRELYLDAFEHVPPIFNTMAEDVVQFVWLAHLAKSYVGVKDCVYHYFIDSGISSNKVIADLGSWERVCSTASVFTVLLSEMMGEEAAVGDAGCGGEDGAAVGDAGCGEEDAAVVGDAGCGEEDGVAVGDAGCGGEDGAAVDDAGCGEEDVAVVGDARGVEEDAAAVGDAGCGEEDAAAVGDARGVEEGGAQVTGAATVPGFTEEQLSSIKLMCRGYVVNNLEQYNKVVAPEIKEDAYVMLCDYWGEDFVKTMEAQR